MPSVSEHHHIAELKDLCYMGTTLGFILTSLLKSFMCVLQSFSISSLTFQKCGNEIFIDISYMSIMPFVIFIFIQFQTTIACMNVASPELRNGYSVASKNP